jgi:UDP-N-acetylmuramyl-tripeptide synthetase
MPYLKDILKGIDYKAPYDISALKIKNVTNDSKSVARGDLFIAVKGAKDDGHKFIDEAVKRGAVAILAEKDFSLNPKLGKVLIRDGRSAVSAIAGNFYGHPSSKMRMIGVTGTNGKTTVTYLIESIFRRAGREAGVIGTVNYRFRDKVYPAKNTTPGPMELHSILADMVKARIRYAVMEVSSHSLDQRRVESVLFDEIIFTNITREHMDYHRTMARYFKAKTMIFNHLKGSGKAILNLDDRKVSTLKKMLPNRAVAYGFSEGADFRAVGPKVSLEGTSFVAVTPEGALEIDTYLIGRHNISNILAALAAASVEKIDLDTIRRGIRDLDSVPGRLEKIDAGQEFKVFVDFAHTKDALYNVLSMLRAITPSRIITVFGCGGDRDRTKRPEMGKAACNFSDKVMITSDNPRFEKPGDIIKEILSGVKGRYSNYEVIPDRRSAIEEALKFASAGDVVLIAGKGHEKYQIIKDKYIPFDDCEASKVILKKILRR